MNVQRCILVGWSPRTLKKSTTFPGTIYNRCLALPSPNHEAAETFKISMAFFQTFWKALMGQQQNEAPAAKVRPTAAPAMVSAAPLKFSKRGDFLDGGTDRVKRLKAHANGEARNDLEAMQVLDDSHTAPDLETGLRHVVDDL